ncbi:metallophosphoesterase family protein [Mesotoga prima]|uniref:metallophosphoesterase family protein n=1 Tax=Mesotoga prima TaxID=1184387 RepID=UPI00031598B2|nr:metallophosphoesterase family protein [Mesotoga prima]
MIMSDSHDNMPRISESVEIAADRGVEVLIHCGDLVSPFAAKALTRFKGELHVVLGNNDGEIVELKNILGGSLIRGPQRSKFIVAR